MFSITLNGQKMHVPKGFTILQATQLANVEVPYFCYHDRLSIAGNCRMCLVSVEGMPKPVASCAMPISEGMVIDTQGPKVQKAREGALEFLLINHPLDCPICDQGGQCDLQDLTMSYGRGCSRYSFSKRVVSEKNLGPLIGTAMNRCIHCTRCVRFAHEIAGTGEMGLLHRGEHAEITSYLGSMVHSELSGNLIDICPVGALTSKPTAAHGRPWEMQHTPSIDVFDAVGSNITIHTRDGQLMHVLPRLNEEINEIWLDDRARFAFDGLRLQRLDRPYMRVNGKLMSCAWEDIFPVIAHQIEKNIPEEMAVILGDHVDAETMLSVQWLMKDELKIPFVECRQDGSWMRPHMQRWRYLFNTGLAQLEEADLIVLLGTNLRIEAPLLNARVRKSYVRRGVRVLAIGPEISNIYPIEWLGETLHALMDSNSVLFSAIQNAQRPAILMGSGMMQRSDIDACVAHVASMLHRAHALCHEWNGLNFVHMAASRVAGFDMGLVSHQPEHNMHTILQNARLGKCKFCYVVGADDFDVEALQKSFVVYQGHHGDRCATVADVVLPVPAYTEKSSLYANMEGRVQQTCAAVSPISSLVKDDVEILYALSCHLTHPMPWTTRQQAGDALAQKLSQNYGHHVLNQRVVEKMNLHDINDATNVQINLQVPVKYARENYYMIDPITRNSMTMAKCMKAFYADADVHDDENVILKQNDGHEHVQ